MKKNAFRALGFTILWVLYCLAVILPNPHNHTWLAAGGLVFGSIFMWLTGWLLLSAAQRVKWPLWGFALLTAALLTADLLAKALVNRTLSGGEILQVVPGWLSIRFAPNYSNNVVLNLLGIVVESGLFHALTKLVAMAVVAFILFWYCRKQGYNTGDGRFRLAMALVAAGGASSILESGFRGYILDFISFAGLVSFDLKDLCLMYGIGLFLLVVIDWEKDAPKAKKEAGAPREAP